MLVIVGQGVRTQLRRGGASWPSRSSRDAVVGGSIAPTRNFKQEPLAASRDALGGWDSAATSLGVDPLLDVGSVVGAA
jgi:hypothetical protein